MFRNFLVIWVLFTALVLPAQELAAVEKGKLTKIGGRVTNAIQKEVNLAFFKDIVSFNEEIFPIPIQQNNNFGMSFQLNEPTQVTFNYMGVDLKLFLEPGDDLFIQFDAVNFRSSIRYSGKGSLHNNFLLQTYKMYNKWDEESLLFEIADRKPMEFRRFMDRIRNERFGFYKDYPEKNQFTEDFKHYACADIDYWWSYYLLRYRVEHFSTQGIDETVIPKEYYSFLDEILVNNDRALSNPYYAYFLDRYLHFRSEVPGKLENEPVSIRVDVPSIFVLSKPEQPPILTEVKKGARMRYLHEKSTFKSKVLIKDALHEDYWYKIKTGNGYIGWVIGVGLVFEDDFSMLVDTSEESDSTSTADPNQFEVAQKYLKGNALYYVMANDLYWRSRVMPLEELEKQVDNFLLINPVKSYDQIAKSTLEKIQKENNTDKIYGSTNYQIVEDFKIENDNLPAQAVVTSVVIDAVKNPVTTPKTATPDKTKIRVNTENQDTTSTVVLESIAYANAALNKAAEPVEKETLIKEEIVKAEIVKEKVVKEKVVKEEVAKEEVAKEEVVKEKVVKEEVVKEEVVKEEVVKEEIVKELVEDTTAVVVIPQLEVQEEFIDIPLSTKKRPSTPITISGKVEAYTGRSLKLVLYTDPVTFIEEEFEFKINGDWTFEVNLNLKEPTLGYLLYGAERSPVFLEPDNQLSFSFHGQAFQKTLHFSGKGNVQNNYLLAQRKFFKGEDEVLRKKMKDSNPTEFSKYMSAQLEARLSFLQKFIDSYEMSFSFTNYAYADIDYWYGYHLLNYPWEHPLYHNQDAPMKVPESYYDFLNNINISQENALPNQHYTYFLDGYFDYQAELPQNEGMTDMEIAERDLQGDVLNYYKCKLYSIACKRGKAKAKGSAMKDFIASCDNETYNDVLRMAYNEAKGLTNGAPAPMFHLKDINGKLVSLDDFKGKTVYIDFWASWCSPCIMQMRNSRNWKATFKDKDVVFVYISLDKDHKTWERHVKNNALQGIHLIADSGNVYQSKIARLYHVKRLPAVFLLDKNTNIHFNSTRDKTRLRLSDMINGLLLSN